GRTTLKRRSAINRRSVRSDNPVSSAASATRNSLDMPWSSSARFTRRQTPGLCRCRNSTDSRQRVGVSGGGAWLETTSAVAADSSSVGGRDQGDQAKDRDNGDESVERRWNTAQCMQARGSPPETGVAEGWRSEAETRSSKSLDG